MIALALGLIVILGASNIFLSSKQSYRTNEALSQIQENSRIAFEMLGRDLRQARLTGCGNEGALGNVVNDNTDDANWFADLANRGLIGFDGAGADTNPALTTGTSSGNHKTGTDNLMLIGAGDASYGLESDYVASDGLDVVESNPVLNKGDLIVVCDPSQADVAQITSLNGSRFRLQTGVGTPGNSAGLTHIYHGSSAIVSPLKSVVWYIGCNPVTSAACDPEKSETSLYRLTAMGKPSDGSVTTQAQEMARGVASMDLSFHVSGATDFIEANSVTSWDANVIDAVRATLRFVAIDHSAGAAQLISRTQSAVITLRNPPKD
jgi:type IV pilus assembly protein PilW